MAVDRGADGAGGRAARGGSGDHVSMARGVAQTVSLHTAAAAIALGMLSNIVLKLAVALLFGSPPFKQIAGGALAVMILAAAAVFALPLF